MKFNFSRKNIIIIIIVIIVIVLAITLPLVLINKDNVNKIDVPNTIPNTTLSLGPKISNITYKYSIGGNIDRSKSTKNLDIYWSPPAPTYTTSSPITSYTLYTTSSSNKDIITPTIEVFEVNKNRVGTGLLGFVSNETYKITIVGNNKDNIDYSSSIEITYP